MHEARIVRRMTLVAHDQTTEVAEPCKHPLDLPAAFVTPQCPAILRFGLFSIRRWGAIIAIPCAARHASSGSESYALSPISRRARVRRSAGSARSTRVTSCGRSTCCAYGDWKTMTVCHCHELRTFAPLGFSHLFAPFLAPTKVPSTKHSLTSIPPRSCKSVARAARTRSKVPSRTHCWKRRCTVVCGGYRSGKSFHGAPVLSIHSTASSTGRRGVHGLPLPSARWGGSGIRGLRRAHWSSVSSILRAPPRTQSTLYEMASSTVYFTVSPRAVTLFVSCAAERATDKQEAMSDTR